jgi:hypothetical protein
MQEDASPGALDRVYGYAASVAIALEYALTPILSPVSVLVVRIFFSSSMKDSFGGLTLVGRWHE